VKISAEFHPLIESLLRQYLDHPGLTKADYREYARKHNAVPIHEDWVAVVLLRTDGTFLFIDTETEPGKVLEEDKRFEIASLVYAAERHESVRPLLPHRPVDARTCDVCSGGGRFTPRNTSTELLCPECFGLGWIASRSTSSQTAV
jgi:hypothetical protein